MIGMGLRPRGRASEIVATQMLSAARWMLFPCAPPVVVTLLPPVGVGTLCYSFTKGLLLNEEWEL
jgi:hypothetical protein